MMDQQTFTKLRKMAKVSDVVRVFPPADSRMVYRSAGRLPGGVDPHLSELFAETNGASILDYCVLACKNQRLPDIYAKLMELWPLNDWLAGEIIPFIVTSIGEIFGYLYRIDGSFGGHPVVYLSHYLDQSALPIGSSVGVFLSNLVEDVEEVLNRDSSAVAIDIGNWPYEMSRWTSRDPYLEDLYRSGVFDDYLVAGSDAEPGFDN